VLTLSEKTVCSSSRMGLVVEGLWSGSNKVTLHWARLVLGWVTVQNSAFITRTP